MITYINFNDNLILSTYTFLNSINCIFIDNISILYLKYLNILISYIVLIILTQTTVFLYTN